MRLEHIVVRNYRNIDELDVWLNNESNYIIGENNLGKSNFLHLLSVVCNGKGFSEDDYTELDKQIEVELQIKMETNEIGFFGDNCDPNDETVIHLKYFQGVTDSYASIICTDTDDSVNLKQIRKINYFNYESTAAPSRELKFDSGKGFSSIVKGMMNKYIEDKTPAFFNERDIDLLKEHMNKSFGKIKGFSSYGLQASVSDNKTEMLSSMFYLSDGERKIDKAGAGIQYTAMASVSILSHIMELYLTKTVSFADRLFTNNDGNKILPIIMAIDEPEVHLHPYLQRSLIRYYKKILSNEDNDFKALLKELFDIDGLSGQLIIVTHSTDALIDDYRNIIRFFKEDGKVTNVSGADPSFNISVAREKHLLMSFPFIKEAFYAHVAILIEGETEYGCIPMFAEKMGVSLDELGICVVNAQGEGKIKPLKELFNKFGINTISIYDGDVRSGANSSENEFYSNEPCFEFEVSKKMFETENQSLMKEIASAIYSQALTEIIDVNYIQKPYTKKLGLNIKNYKSCNIDSLDITSLDFYNVYSCWLYVKKGVISGRIVGTMMPEKLIPDCYRKAILKAKEVALCSM